MESSRDLKKQIFQMQRNAFEIAVTVSWAVLGDFGWLVLVGWF